MAAMDDVRQIERPCHEMHRSDPDRIGACMTTAGNGPTAGNGTACGYPQIEEEKNMTKNVLILMGSP